MALPDLDIFGNAGRSGYDDIVRAGPSWWTEFLEMDVNYRFAGWTLDLMAYQLDRMLNNLFFRHADEETIRKAEKYLQISYGKRDVSLDERRATVEAYFAGTGKLSGSVIRSIVESYTGLDSEVWTNSRRIYVRIMANDDVEMSAGLIAGLIRRRIPGHMELIILQVLTIIELFEEYIPRFTFRMDMPWWTLHILNGQYNLDGELILDQLYPMEFMLAHRILTEHTEMIWLFGRIRFASILSETMEDCLRNRLVFTLWSGFLLDGRYSLDGTHELAAPLYPEFNGLTMATPMETVEDIGFNLFIPSLALCLDGTGYLDGNYSLNSGREEL